MNVDAASAGRPSLDALHASVRSLRWLRHFTVFTRVLLALGFIPPSLVKLMNQRFTLLTVDHPVGFFFEAMYRTGLFWQFIGLAQIGAAVLLLFPRTATLGALLYFPAILSIFLITVGMHFQGTWIITGLMLLANVYLLLWDYDRLKRAATIVLAK